MSFIKVIVVLAVLLAQPLWAQGGIPPQLFGLYGRSVPICSQSSGGRKCEQVIDMALVIPMGSESSPLVQIQLSFDGGHRCKLDGLGEWTEEQLVVRGPAQCKVRLVFTSDGVAIRDDPNSPCSKSLCSGTGAFDGYFPKAGSR
jgi:hypothetical protein